MKKIVIDIYGADAGAQTVIDGIGKALNSQMDFFPVIVGEEALITSTLEDCGIEKSKYEIINTTDFITQNEPPTVIFRGRNESSMALAYERLKSDSDCFALLSPGSTGALLVGSVCRLGLIPGLKFPALASALPCAGERLLCLVDCGANVDCSANDLTKLARLGNVFCKCFCSVENPKVGLLSVGREDGKGNAVTKEAYTKIKELDLNFVGNLEGSDIVSGYADVIVSDGFAGNILLKSTEAAGLAALEEIEKLSLEREVFEKIQKALIKKFDFNSRGAATFLGTKKTVVKMHGCANEDTVVASIDQILRLEKAEFSKHIANSL